MELNANGSILNPEMIRFSFDLSVKEIVLHPEQKVQLEQSVVFSVTPIEKGENLAGIKITPNILVPEDQVWLVDERGEIVSTIRNLARFNFEEV